MWGSALWEHAPALVDVSASVLFEVVCEEAVALLPSELCWYHSGVVGCIKDGACPGLQDQYVAVMQMQTCTRQPTRKDAENVLAWTYAQAQYLQKKEAGYIPAGEQYMLRCCLVSLPNEEGCSLLGPQASSLLLAL